MYITYIVYIYIYIYTYIYIYIYIYIINQYVYLLMCSIFENRAIYIGFWKKVTK